MPTVHFHGTNISRDWVYDGQITKNIENGKDCSEKCAAHDKIKQETERNARIEASTYCPQYKYIRSENVPKYLFARVKERMHLARWRCGNQQQYWLVKECPKCFSTDISLRHRLDCEGFPDESENNFLCEDGRGIEILEKITYKQSTAMQ